VARPKGCVQGGDHKIRAEPARGNLLVRPNAGGWEARFEPVEGGTKVIFRAAMNPKGIMGFVAPVMTPWARRQTREFLVRFKEWSEAQSAV
jgi:hypothetical protein